VPITRCWPFAGRRELNDDLPHAAAEPIGLKRSDNVSLQARLVELIPISPASLDWDFVFTVGSLYRGLQLGAFSSHSTAQSASVVASDASALPRRVAWFKLHDIWSGFSGAHSHLCKRRRRCRRISHAWDLCQCDSK